MRDGFVKVAAGTPAIRVADCRYNAESCFTLMREAYRQGVRAVSYTHLDVYKRQEPVSAPDLNALNALVDAVAAQ